MTPNVWTRRALQEKTISLERTVLHQCIRPRVGAHAPGHHGNPRASDLITGHASEGYWVISSRMRWEDHFSISSISLADLGGQKIVAVTSGVS
jgi:hypothetical protein